MGLKKQTSVTYTYMGHLRLSIALLSESDLLRHKPNWTLINNNPGKPLKLVE